MRTRRLFSRRSCPVKRPATHELPFKKVKVYQVMAGAARDDAMLPVGQASLLEPLQVGPCPSRRR